MGVGVVGVGVGVAAAAVAVVAVEEGGVVGVVEIFVVVVESHDVFRYMI